MPPKKKPNNNPSTDIAGPSGVQNPKKKRKGTAGCVKLKNRVGWNECDSMVSHVPDEHLEGITNACKKSIEAYLVENNLDA